MGLSHLRTCLTNSRAPLSQSLKFLHNYIPALPAPVLGVTVDYSQLSQLKTAVQIFQALKVIEKVMGKKLPPDQLELYRRIDEILYYKWDPIGVSDGAGGRDEYHSYLPKVFSHALENNSPEAIAQYLGAISTETMGLPASVEHDNETARLIMEVKEDLGL